MTRRYRKSEPKLFERWQVQREYFTDDCDDPCCDGYPVVHATKAEAEAELEKIKSDKGCWGGWYNPGDTLYVSRVLCSEY